jgi:predicted TIM-barrel fold metal-dependent hydrolase
MTLDLDSLVAIDVHTHAEVSEDGHVSLPDDLMAASAKYFRSGDGRTPTLDQLADRYRELRMAAVVFTVDSEHQTGHPPVPNDDVARAAQRHPDVLIPFGSIDPHRGAAGVEEARRLVTEMGVRGFKFHPTLQGFSPDDPMAYPLYEAIQELGVPALFHSGQTGIGAGMPGGNGLRLRHSNPMLLDDVAAYFPELTIIVAHPSFPWQDEALSVATHKANVYLDLSGWSPKYFPPQLVQYANTILKHKVLFGSDYPLITPERWISDFDTLPIKDEVRPLILKENAIRVLGLRGATDRG